MAKNNNKKAIRYFCILFALVLFVHTPLAAFAAQVEDNRNGDIVDVVESGDSMDHNAGVILDNSGKVNDNSGTTGDNNGTVVTNNGDIYDNNGTVNTNNGYIGNNNGGVSDNNGTVNTNNGMIYNSDGTVQVNEGEVDNNYGRIGVNRKSGEVEYNYDTVSVNYGEVDTNYGTVKENRASGEIQDNQGTVVKNMGTVYNSGIVRKNLGKVFDNGGTVVDDQGKRYFRVWFLLPTALPKKAWSYSVDKGFVSYRGFDRWLEKNSVGQLTFRLKKGYGWTYDLSAKGDPNGYKARLNKDGSFTIIVDRMHEWMQEVGLLIPLIKIGNRSNEPVKTTAAVRFHKVTYDLDGGAFNKGTEYEETGKVDRYIEQGAELTFSEIPEKDGCRFVCWEEVVPEDEGNAPRYEVNDKYLVTEDVEFKAVWK